MFDVFIYIIYVYNESTGGHNLMASAAQMTKVTESMQCIWLAVRFHASATEVKKAINITPTWVLGQGLQHMASF